MSKQTDTLTLLTNAALSLNKASKAISKAKETEAGSYSIAVQAADKAGSAKVLGEAFATLFNRIRTDGKFAVQCGAEKVSKPKPNGPRYKVPSGLMSAKSVTLGAFEYGVSFSDENGLRSFGAIRKDYSEAKAAAKLAELSGDEKTRHDLCEMLDSIKASVSDFGADGLAELFAAVTDIHNAVNEVQAQAAEANKAEGLAQAA